MIDIVPSKEVCDFMFLHISLRLEPVLTFALYGSAPTAVIVATLVTECPSVEAVLAPPVSGTTSNSWGQLALAVISQPTDTINLDKITPLRPAITEINSLEDRN